MKRLLLLLLLLTQNTIFSQTIEFLEKKDSIENPKYKQFIFLSKETDISESRFIAKVKSTGNLKNVTQLYDKIKNELQNYGANSFKFESFKKLNDENGELILSTFYSNDSILTENFKKLPKNMVYVYGDQDMTNKKTQTYKLQGEKQEIENGKFKKIEVKLGEELKINKGGFTGMTYWIKGEADKNSYFLSFSGIGLNGVSNNYQTGGVGVNITTGKINKIEPNLALVLLEIFEEQH